MRKKTNSEAGKEVKQNRWKEKTEQTGRRRDGGEGGAALGRAKTKSSAFQLDCEFSAPENVIISLNTAHHS